MDLINKKAIVFGGTSGIGLATVKMLQIAGTEVVAIGRSSEKKSQLPNGIDRYHDFVVDPSAAQQE